MVGDWWFTPGNLYRGRRPNHRPRTPTWLFAGPTFLSLVPGSKMFLFGSNSQLFVGINGFFNYFMVVMHLDALVEGTTLCCPLIPHPLKNICSASLLEAYQNYTFLKWCLTASTGFKKKIHILYFHPSHVIESILGQCMSL